MRLQADTEKDSRVSGLESLKGKLSSLSRLAAAKDVLTVFSGNGAGQLLGFLAVLTVMRHLSPEQFGLYSAAIALMVLVSQFTDLGLSTAYVRFASGSNSSDRDLEALSGMTFLLKTSIGFLVLLVGFIIAPILSHHVFRDQVPADLIRLAFVGSLGATLWGYFQAILQARGRFKEYSSVVILNNLFKYAGIGLLLVLGHLSVRSAVMVMVATPFVGFLVDRHLLKIPLWRPGISFTEYKEALGKLWDLGRWVTLSTLATMLMMRLDVLMIQAFKGNHETGIYASANQLAMLFPLLSGALTTVLLPKISSYRSNEEIKNFVWKSLKIIPFLVLLLISVFFISPWALPLILGAKYLSAVPVFLILVSGFVIGIATNPLSLVLYVLNKAHLLTIMNFLQLGIFLGLSLVLIPTLGSAGSAWASFAVRIFGGIFIGVVVWAEGKVKH